MMRKLLSAIAIGLLASFLMVAATAVGKGPKSPKQVAGTVSVVATPSTLGPADTTTTVAGNVKANSSCRKDRIVRFAYTGSGGTTQLAETAETALERRLHRRPSSAGRRRARRRSCCRRASIRQTARSAPRRRARSQRRGARSPASRRLLRRRRRSSHSGRATSEARAVGLCWTARARYVRRCGR